MRKYVTRKLLIISYLLVGEDGHDDWAHVAVVDDAVQLALRFVDTVAVRRVHHEDECLRANEVVPPERTDALLPAHILWEQTIGMESKVIW